MTHSFSFFCYFLIQSFLKNLAYLGFASPHPKARYWTPPFRMYQGALYPPHLLGSRQPTRKGGFRHIGTQRNRRLKPYSLYRFRKWSFFGNGPRWVGSSSGCTTSSTEDGCSSFPLLNLMKLKFSLAFTSSWEGSFLACLSKLPIEVAS